MNSNFCFLESMTAKDDCLGRVFIHIYANIILWLEIKNLWWTLYATMEASEGIFVFPVPSAQTAKRYTKQMFMQRKKKSMCFFFRFQHQQAINQLHRKVSKERGWESAAGGGGRRPLEINFDTLELLAYWEVKDGLTAGR